MNDLINFISTTNKERTSKLCNKHHLLQIFRKIKINQQCLKIIEKSSKILNIISKKYSVFHNQSTKYTKRVCPFSWLTQYTQHRR